MGIIQKAETKRNKRIHKLKKQGKTFGQLALLFKLSRARIYQLYAREEKRQNMSSNV